MSSIARRAVLTMLASATSRPIARAARPETVPEDALFKEQGLDGAMVLLDVRSGKRTLVARHWQGASFAPASTFKVPNTLIGLETGVIPDERFRLPWDGVVRDRPELNRDHDLASAMQASVLWFYQEVARRIGPERMLRHLKLFGYGNADISGGIDQFWLGAKGGLRITPFEQVEFLRKVDAGTLPVKPRNLAILRRVMSSQTIGDVTLRWKTGLTPQEGRKVGWQIGFVERGARTSFIYAGLMLGPAAKDWQDVLRARIELPRKLLVRLQAIPPGFAEPPP